MRSGALFPGGVARGRKPAWHLIRGGSGPIYVGVLAWIGHGSGGVDDPDRVQSAANDIASIRSGVHTTRTEGHLQWNRPLSSPGGEDGGDGCGWAWRCGGEVEAEQRGAGAQKVVPACSYRDTVHTYGMSAEAQHRAPGHEPHRPPRLSGG
eukprot:365504-Chlamydomonas_euryale.AAC.2